MIIGLDLSVLQTAHRQRGIGAVAFNFIKNIPDAIKTDHRFVIFVEPGDYSEITETLDANNINYQVSELKKISPIKLGLPGPLRLVNKLLNGFRQMYYDYAGEPRLADHTELDIYLQFDPSKPMPRIKDTKTATVLYDLIPYVLEADYLWTYNTARQHHEPRKAALRKAIIRKRYIQRAKLTAQNTDLLLSISKHTKDDYIRYAQAPADKISIWHLGVDAVRADNHEAVTFERYVDSSWGYLPKPIDLTSKPFMLYVGGADPRRRLIDVVAAYNKLRAHGRDIRLVLAGDVMKGPNNIPVPHVQKYISQSSYLHDMAFLGFVTEAQREWLYQHATAVIYPSVYEGFGLPVLEAMSHGTPVITYDNTSISEVAGSAALYAHDHESIKTQVEQLLDDPKLGNRYRELGLKQAAKYSWQATVKKAFELLIPS